MEAPKKSNLTQDPQRTKLDQEPAPQQQTPPAPPAAPAQKLVKLLAHRPTQLPDGAFLNPGETADVTPEVAALFTKKYSNTYAFVGLREGGADERPETFQRCTVVG